MTDNFTSVMWQQPIEFPIGQGDHVVVITKTSPITDFLYFDAIRFIDPTAALTVGQYQENYAGLTYNGTWTTNATTKSTTTNGTLTFKFTGNGFGFITANPLPNVAITVSCIILSGSTDVCADPSSTPASGGYVFYNLRQGTYNVIISYTGSGSLFIDRVFVLNTPTTILQPGTYEDNNPGIVYSPLDLWTTIPNAAYSGGTSHLTTQKGGVVQVRFNGNSLILYQLAYLSAASDLNLCVFLTDAGGNPTTVCSTFSQNTATTNFTAPIAFYGFGSGTHEIIIENRSQGLQFAVDKILIN